MRKLLLIGVAAGLIFAIYRVNRDSDVLNLIKFARKMLFRGKQVLKNPATTLKDLKDLLGLYDDLAGILRDKAPELKKEWDRLADELRHFVAA